MKKAVLLTVGVSCLLVGMAVPAKAQFGRTMTLRGDVPFTFVSGNRTIQAGEYSIEIREIQVQFMDARGHVVCGVFSNGRKENGRDEQPRLVFHRYGDTYFLRQIWTTDHKLDFGMSRSEYKLQAGLKVEQGTVILAMR
jgi:hypothetical protein